MLDSLLGRLAQEITTGPNPANYQRIPDRSLRQFVRDAWHVVEPATPFHEGWHLAAICEHLEAATNRQIRNLIINIPPRCMKPVDVDALVLLGDGSRKRLGDVTEGDWVVTHTGNARQVLAVHEQGELPTLRIETFAGRIVYAAPDHPFLTPEGWVQAQHLRPGQALATVPRPSLWAGSQRSLAEFSLAGYFVGDGCTAGAGHSFFATISAADPVYADQLRTCATKLGFTVKEARNRLIQFNLSGGVRPWLEEIGLDRKTSYTKRVPAFVFQGNPEQIGAFVAAYFHCDGCVGKRNSGKRSHYVSFSSVSRDLLTDVQHLLLRLGVPSRIRRRENRTGYAGTPEQPYVSFSLDITTQDAVARFFGLVPVLGAKRDRLADYEALRTGFDATLEPDPVVSVEPAGAKRCRCLTVAEDHSFTANDLAVRNSLAVSVFWPCWVWTFAPHTRWLFSSYSDQLSTRDSIKCRRIIQSSWYQAEFPGRVQLVSDQNVKTRFENSRTGYRISTSVSGVGTGEGGDFIVVDDPHNVKDAESDVVREAACQWWFETMSSRGNNPETAVRVIVMQRVHERDLTGQVLGRELGYDHLRLPMEWERPRIRDDTGKPEFVQRTSIGFTDPRSVEGQLLWPQQFNRDSVAVLKKNMGLYAAAGQLQQRPAPREGGMFPVGKIIPVDRAPGPHDIVARVRYWDKGGGKVGTPTAGVKMSIAKDGLVYVEHVERGQWEIGERNERMKLIAEMDGQDTWIWVEQEPGSGGKESALYSITMLRKYSVRADKVTGDKVIRADPFAAQVQAGLVRMVRGPWNYDYISELSAYPNSAFLDQGDASGGAYNKLSEAFAVPGQSNVNRRIPKVDYGNF